MALKSSDATARARPITAPRATPALACIGRAAGAAARPRSWRRLLALAAIGVALAQGPRPASAAETAWQAPESVRAAAEAFARRFTGRADAAVEAIAVDDRLRLPSCGEPLSTEAAGAFNAGRGTVVVACRGPQPWRLYVPIRLSHDVPVVVARRALHRGDVVSADDLAVVERAAASLPYEYFASPDDAVGMTLRRSLPEGAVLVPAAVDRPSAVERGARVTLVAGRGAVLVKSEGIALHRAALGERVRVETASGRIVEGRAEAPDRVRVGP